MTLISINFERFFATIPNIETDPFEPQTKKIILDGIWSSYYSHINHAGEELHLILLFFHVGYGVTKGLSSYIEPCVYAESISVCLDFLYLSDTQPSMQITTKILVVCSLSCPVSNQA